VNGVRTSYPVQRAAPGTAHSQSCSPAQAGQNASSSRRRGSCVTRQTAELDSQADSGSLVISTGATVAAQKRGDSDQGLRAVAWVSTDAGADRAVDYSAPRGHPPLASSCEDTPFDFWLDDVAFLEK
jgi:hypothetical protein